MGRIILATVLIVFLIGIFIWYFQTQKSQQPDNPTPITPTATTENSIPFDEIEIDKLRLGGSSYSDKKGVYTVLYPNEYSVDQINNGEYVRFFKKGPTQTGQTEVYDGVIVHFQSVELGQMSMEEWIEAQIKTSTSDGTSQLTSQKIRVTVNNYPGYTYTMRGLGEHTYYVFQKDPSSQHAVSITTLVADPENVGFQKEVDAMLYTLELLK